MSYDILDLFCFHSQQFPLETYKNIYYFFRLTFFVYHIDQCKSSCWVFIKKFCNEKKIAWIILISLVIERQNLESSENSKDEFVDIWKLLVQTINFRFNIKWLYLFVSPNFVIKSFAVDIALRGTSKEGVILKNLSEHSISIKVFYGWDHPESSSCYWSCREFFYDNGLREKWKNWWKIDVKDAFHVWMFCWPGNIKTPVVFKSINPLTAKSDFVRAKTFSSKSLKICEQR